MLTGLLKPEYLFRPRQLLRRLCGGKKSGFVEVTLPWGDSIRVSADDIVGAQIATLGLYDLVVTETLWRLCEDGDNVVDVGANIGYTTFVMAKRIGRGTIQSFEPHPVLFQELSDNVDSLRRQGCLADVQIHPLALGPIEGSLPLHVPKDFASHRGESSLAAPTHLECAAETVVVPVSTLDAVLADQPEIGVVKMDVEGFEIEVLRGAEQAFGNRRVRDCVFEEHHTYPSPVTDWFESHGYEVFRLDRRLGGLRLLAPYSSVPRTVWTATNFVATSDPARLRQRLSRPGWDCLRG